MGCKLSAVRGTGHSMNEGFNPVKVQGLAQANHRPKAKNFFFLGFGEKTCDQRHRNPAEVTDPFQDLLPIHDGH